MATINGIDLGTLQSERIKKDSGISPVPLPNASSDEALLIPILGALSYITVTGKKGGSFADAQTFIGHLSEWVTDGGNSDKANVTYVGDLNPGPFSVRVLASDWETTSDEPFMVNYTIQMVEGYF